MSDTITTHITYNTQCSLVSLYLVVLLLIVAHVVPRDQKEALGAESDGPGEVALNLPGAHLQKRRVLSLPAITGELRKSYGGGRVRERDGEGERAREGEREQERGRYGKKREGDRQRAKGRDSKREGDAEREREGDNERVCV